MSQRPSFFHHLHPPTIPAAQARWRYTLGAGGLSVFFVLVILATGMLELFYYVPTAEDAAISVQTITFLVPYGNLVRNVHYWAAQALVLTAGIHLIRVVFTGAYGRPRRLNYVLGVTLFVLILSLDFTGYVLRWDEGVRWALVAATNLMKTVPGIGDWLYRVGVGGGQLGTAALVRFYSWHLFGLMLALIIVGVWHVFRVRRDGGIAVPPPNQRADPERITRFDLVRREAMAALIAGAVLLLLAAFLPAPIAPPINPQAAPAAEARAPWFFLWVQELLRLGDPFWMGVAIPAAAVLFLFLIPFILPAPPPEQLGRWFPRGGRLAQILVAGLLLAVAVLTLLARFT